MWSLHPQVTTQLLNGLDHRQAAVLVRHVAGERGAFADDVERAFADDVDGRSRTMSNGRSRTTWSPASSNAPKACRCFLKS